MSNYVPHACSMQRPEEGVGPPGAALQRVVNHHVGAEKH